MYNVLRIKINERIAKKLILAAEEYLEKIEFERNCLEMKKKTLFFVLEIDMTVIY